VSISTGRKQRKVKEECERRISWKEYPNPVSIIQKRDTTQKVVKIRV